MTHTQMFPCPKPERRPPKERKPMKRTRMKQYNAKRKGSAFPKHKNPAFRRWLRTENECLLAHRYLTKRFSMHDIELMLRRFVHVCWGPIDPAHVGQKQSQGAADVGHCVPLCRAAHDFYDQHRSEWRRVTGYGEKRMANEAGGYGLKYVERGGKVTEAA